jgi:small subunit ribosomal protein S20
LHFQRERSYPLANHKSALKRAGQNEIRRLRNRSVKSRVKTVVKEVRQAVASDAGESIASNFKTAQATIDKAVKKGVLHKRTGARKIARLAKLAQTSQSQS